MWLRVVTITISFKNFEEKKIGACAVAPLVLILLLLYKYLHMLSLNLRPEKGDDFFFVVFVVVLYSNKLSTVKKVELSEKS